MEKEVSLFHAGQSVTPIMQKFDDLKCAIARYNRVTAITEKPKILFALGIITFIDEACSVLETYLKDLEHHVCRDALALDFKRLADKGYWLKDDRLRQEMHAFASKTLGSYGVTFGLDGVMFEDTLQIYKVIEEKVEQMVALLKMVEAALRSAPPQLYQNFYHNLRAQYDEEQAVNDFKNWLRSSGIPSLDKFKTFRAEEIIRFLKGGTLDCASEPSLEEWEKVDIERFKRQVPLSYQEGEWFRKCFDRLFVIFNRTVSWQGDILVPNYSCAGLFIFQHWDQLTESDIQAIFYLDKTLELIHEEMTALNHDTPPMINVEEHIRHSIALLMEEQYGDEPLFCQQSHWQAVYRILVDKDYCRDSDFNGFDTFIQRVMPEKVNKPYRKDSVKQISQTDFNKPFDKWKYDSAVSHSHRTYKRMVAVASRFKAILEENGL